MVRNIQRYGWKPSLRELADVKYSIGKPVPIPSEVELRPDFPSVYNQLLTSSCTGNMGAGIYQYGLKQAGLPDFMPSRLEIYYNARMNEGSTNRDSGAEIKDVLKGMNKLGVCSEKTWSFNNPVTKKPSDAAYLEAKSNIIHNYATLNNTNLDELRHCLAHKFPIGFGFTVYSSFETEEVAKSGTVLFPTDSEWVVGGHAVILVGYNDKLQIFYVRNSWGADWGDEGYFTMPYKYVCNPSLAADFWMLRLK